MSITTAGELVATAEQEGFAKARKRAALVAQKIGTELGEPAIGFAIAEKIRELKLEI